MSRPSLKSVEWFGSASDASRAVTVYLDRTTVDFAHLTSQTIEIDGAPFLCLGASSRAHAPPFHPPEIIALRVQRLQ